MQIWVSQLITAVSEGGRPSTSHQHVSHRLEETTEPGWGESGRPGPVSFRNVPLRAWPPLGRPGPLGDPRCCLLAGGQGAPSLRPVTRVPREVTCSRGPSRGKLRLGALVTFRREPRDAGLAHPADAEEWRSRGAELGLSYAGLWAVAPESSLLLEGHPGWRGAWHGRQAPSRGKAGRGRDREGSAPWVPRGS